jgi:hypothetical protein
MLKVTAERMESDRSGKIQTTAFAKTYEKKPLLKEPKLELLLGYMEDHLWQSEAM